MNNKNLLDDLTQDFGGKWGAGLGTFMTLFGVLTGGVGFVIAGPILILVAALLAVAGWFTKK